MTWYIEKHGENNSLDACELGVLMLSRHDK